ncbi:MAG: hypothetical protein LBV12_09875 [Puniceicoccales bacterium]|nr:hypothetical protein [Puniceicoccales bacterium]
MARLIRINRDRRCPAASVFRHPPVPTFLDINLEVGDPSGGLLQKKEKLHAQLARLVSRFGKVEKPTAGSFPQK